ncbi:hypothetical protein THIOSC15_1390002 [uncultured Thiomicrorhabdus sp.]
MQEFQIGSEFINAARVKSQQHKKVPPQAVSNTGNSAAPKALKPIAAKTSYSSNKEIISP